MKLQVYKSLIRKAYIENIYTNEYDLSILGLTKLENFIISNISNSKVILNIFSSVDGISCVYVNESICIEMKSLQNSSFYEYAMYPNTKSFCDELKQRLLDIWKYKCFADFNYNLRDNKRVQRFIELLEGGGIDDACLLEATDDLAFLNSFSVSISSLNNANTDQLIGLYLGERKCWLLDMNQKNYSFASCNIHDVIAIMERKVSNTLNKVYCFSKVGVEYEA